MRCQSFNSLKSHKKQFQSIVNQSQPINFKEIDNELLDENLLNSNNPIQKDTNFSKDYNNFL